MRKIMTLIMLIAVTAATGCHKASHQSVESHFRLEGNRVLFVVENNSDDDLVVDGFSGGVTYRETEYVNGEEIGEDGPVELVRVTPGRFEMAASRQIVIPQKGEHAFTIQGYRPLKHNESANIYAVLKPLNLNIQGSLEIKSNKPDSGDGK